MFNVEKAHFCRGMLCIESRSDRNLVQYLQLEYLLYTTKLILKTNDVYSLMAVHLSSWQRKRTCLYAYDNHLYMHYVPCLCAFFYKISY